jgi:TatD DNase family protein
MPPRSPAALVDSHAHIQEAEFKDDLSAVLARARESGVEKIIVVGGAGDISSNYGAVDLARTAPGLFATVGMHPHDAKDVGAEEFDKLKELAGNPEVVAVGETGLDFYYDRSPRAIQRQVFSDFIALARETGLPLVVHDRDAHQEIADLLRTEGRGDVKGVIHCFTGDFAAAKEFLDLGFFLSFSGIITFKNAEPLRDVLKKIPFDRVLIETDSPFLAPVPHRGKRNEPAFVIEVAATVARVRNISLETMAQVTSDNVHRLFEI